jgi:hypothetical protein
MPRPLMQAHPYHIRCMAMEILDRSFRLEEYAQLLERQVRSSCFCGVCLSSIITLSVQGIQC